jgi:plastocyanin
VSKTGRLTVPSPRVIAIGSDRPHVAGDRFPRDIMPAQSRPFAAIRSNLLLLATAVGLAACSNSTSPNAGPTITIRDFTFSPATLTVKAGTTVEWLNDGPSPHTTTSDASLWESGALTPPSGSGPYSGGSGGTFSYTFMTPGTFTYHCALHLPTQYPAFVGSVVVTP